MGTQLEIEVGQFSDKGIKDKNEDFYGAYNPKDSTLETKGIVVAVADGMGSCEYAAEASEQSIKSFITDYYSTPETWSVKKSAGKVLTALNSWLLSQSRNDHARSMVTTFSSIVFKSTTAYLFHVGDSRIYRLRKGDLECLTRDHRINVSEKENYLSRAMGIDQVLDIDYKKVTVQIGDLFLLTTDGIHDYLRDKDIKSFISNHLNDLDKCCDELVQKALSQGSHDNLTAQLVRIKSLPNQDANEVFSRLTRLPFPPPSGSGNDYGWS